MLLQLTNCYAAVLPKHITADWRSPDFAVGTGPFKMKQAVAGTSIELQKNPDYYRKGFPYLDGIKIFAIPDIGAQMDAMSTKRIDMTNPMGFTIPSEEDMERFLKTSPGASWELRTQTYGNIIWINTRVPELKDVRVRKALALLEDRPALIEAAYGNKRWGGTSNAFFTPFWGLPPAEIAKVVGWDKPADQRLAEAKKLMADAGYADGFKTKIAMPTVNMPSYQRVSVLMDDIYRKNLKVELDIVPYPSADAIKKRNDGAYGLFNYSPLALLGDPDEFMPLFRTSGRENYSGYSNPDIDKLWDQQAKEMDVAKRKQLLQQIERILLTDLPAMPLQWNNYVTAWWPYVKGYVVADTTYTSNLAFETVWLDK
jgi:ABC-type transport system substrate-binding protein